MTLGLYNKKRDFSKTNEPKGKVDSTKSSLRFVIQYHEARAKHYDFRLEHKGVLVSFAVPKGLSQKPSDKRLAIHVEDHPTSYIDFHGTIPKGNYGAGTVEIWDKGTYTTNINLSKGLKAGNFKVTLSGNKLGGTWNFAKMDEKNWIVVKCKQNKKTNNPFEKVDVQLATLVKNVPEGKKWIYEIKYDGYRTIAFCEYGKTKLISRNGIDFSKKFASIIPSLNELSQDHSFVLDGEMVVFDKNGRSNFSELQSEIKKKGNSFSYVVFDILALDGQDLRDEKLSKRKEILKKLIKNLKNNVIFSDFTKKEGQKTYNAAKKLGLEGIVAKDINSPYLGTRNLDWQKIKCRQSSEFVVGGFVTTSQNEDLSSILVGVYEDGKLVFVGKVGTGFDASQRKELNKKFSQIATKKCPFENECDIETSKNIVWIRPKLVAQIEYAEVTPTGSLRQPSFLGLRADKEPKDCVWEKQND